MIDPEANVLKYKDLQTLLRDVCKQHKLNSYGMNTIFLVHEIKRKNPKSIFHLIQVDGKERDSQYLFRLKAAVIKQREHKKRLDVFGSIGS